jgi:hypothetical protein
LTVLAENATFFSKCDHFFSWLSLGCVEHCFAWWWFRCKPVRFESAQHVPGREGVWIGEFSLWSWRLGQFPPAWIQIGPKAFWKGHDTFSLPIAQLDAYAGGIRIAANKLQ